MEAKQKFIETIPIGDIEQDVLRHVLQIIKEKFNTGACIGPALPVPSFAFDPTRSQFNASIILEQIRKAKSPDALKALGVIEQDIFAKGLNYVFGQAILGGCCAAISLNRLRIGTDLPGARTLFLQRVEKEAMHELGHTFGLRHCSNPRCIMYFSSNLTDTDRKQAVFCPECGSPLIG
ncbi:MAG: archaemetzincin family Zn-dependent metalloprotease [Candidatus Aquicultor sp.]